MNPAIGYHALLSPCLVSKASRTLLGATSYQPGYIETFGRTATSYKPASELRLEHESFTAFCTVYSTWPPR